MCAQFARQGLRRRLPDVSVIQVGEPGSPPKGTPDPQLLEFCEEQRRLLVTADSTTMASSVRPPQRGHNTWGVLLIGPNASLGQMLDELALIHEATEGEEWIGTFSSCRCRGDCL